MTAFACAADDGPMRLVVVGAGNMGQAWLRTIAGTPAVQLVGVVDLDEGLAQRAAGTYGPGIITGRDVADVAVRSRAQAVVDVTVPPAHRAVNTQALLAGLPVLCEKPIAPTVAEALSLAAVSEVSGQLLMTSQSRRYYPTLARLRDMARSLGGVGIVTTEFFKAPRFGGFRDAMAQPLLVDMAIHAFDVARYLLGADPVSVNCQTFNPAWSWYAGDAAANAAFTFPGGAHYLYTGSWCSPGLETSWNGNWRVSGPRGTAAWDGDGDPVVAYTDGTDVAPPVDGRAQTRPEIAGALDEFVHALRTGRVPSGEVHANVHSLAMVEAAVRSAHERRTVDLHEVFDDAYATAVRTEGREDVREALRRWGSAQGGIAVSAVTENDKTGDAHAVH